jgi:thiol-disulfide isomerase/thioredoxin
MMRSKTIILITPLFILACNFLLSVHQQDDNNPHPASHALETATVQSALSKPHVLTSPTDPFVIIRINKASGNLMAQLAIESKKAGALGLSPFIEFEASWCPPCKAIDKSIKDKDPLTIKAFKGVYLIRADVDEWGWGDGNYFEVGAIPIYYKLSGSGKPTGAVLDGGAWNEDIPKKFAPRVR